MKEIGIFELLDLDMANYLGLALSTYSEKVEALDHKKEDLFVDLLQQWLDGENVKDDILELFEITLNEI